MKRNILLIALVALAGGFIAPNETTLPTAARSGETYTIDWYTIDSGGTMSASGGTYTLGGTIGQPDAGSMSSGGYTLMGGFWGSVERLYHVYLPLVLR